MPYAIYLRKSRADEEAERRGEGETLARHKRLLLETAQRLGLNVGAIYQEVVSGETIASRPKMQKLLAEVEAGQWEGVLVAEVERLARGDSIDQGLVSQAFQCSGTKIITPMKTYDPANEFDEEYFEFGLFMSRREYNTIKRRMNAGRLASVKEGKYMGKTDPFGYTRVKLADDKGYTLRQHAQQAELVRNMFQWYLEDGQGLRPIARRLNALGSRTSAGIEWSPQSVRNVLRNCLYAGYVTWGRKSAVKSVTGGRVVHKRKVNRDGYTMQKGLHEGIVSLADWEAVQHKLDTTPAVHLPDGKPLRNPFQGLLYCAACGHSMQLHSSARLTANQYGVECRWLPCKMVSSSMPQVETVLLAALREWLKQYRTTVQSDSVQQSEAEKEALALALANANCEAEKVSAQMQRAFELVEQGVYTAEQFIQRQKALSDRLEEQKAAACQAQQALDNLAAAETARLEIIPRMEHVIDAYPQARSAQEKNNLLKSILHKIMYEKTAPCNQKAVPSILKLTLYPMIPAAHSRVKDAYPHS